MNSLRLVRTRVSAIATACGLAAASLVVVTAARAATTLVVETPSGPRQALVVAGGDGARPTVVVLHGGGGNGAYTRRTSGFAEAAATRGFNVVFPDGLQRQWNDGREDRAGGADDVAFLATLAERLVAERIALRERLYLAGISNGGIMSFAMVCRAPGTFAAIGTIIANMSIGDSTCEPAPVPLVMVNGTADPMVPFAGGSVAAQLRRSRGRVLGAMETAARFARADGCAPTPRETALPRTRDREGPRVTRLDWTDCADGLAVTMYRVDGGGHVVSGGSTARLLPLGEGSPDFDAADAVLDFFASSPDRRAARR